MRCCSADATRRPRARDGRRGAAASAGSAAAAERGSAVKAVLPCVQCAAVTAIPGEFAPPARLLLGPGPSEVHPRVLRAMATPLLGHLDPAFITMMDEVKTMLR